MTWRAEPRWGAVLEPAAQPPTEALVKVEALTGIIIDGFVLHGGTTSIRYEDTVEGAIRNNVVYGALFPGITLEDSYGIIVEGNRVFSNGLSAGGGAGIKAVRGTDLLIRGNLVYLNSEQGISLESQGQSSPNNIIESNTVDKNGKDGIRLVGPVGQTHITNNISTRNGVGVGGVGLKIPPHPSIVTEDYNNAWGNGNDPDFDFDLPSPASPHDLSVDPLYVDPDGLNGVHGGSGWADDLYHLAHVETGQPANSPCVDTGDPAAPLEGTTATDNFLDEGVPDRGFHYPAHTTLMQQFTLMRARALFRKEDDQYFIASKLSGSFTLGPGNNGTNLSMERVRIEIDTFVRTFPAGACEQLQAKLWRCKSTNPNIILTFDFRKGSFSIDTDDIPIFASPPPASTRLNMHIGDDVGSAERSYTGGAARFP
jgi:parallel beta-helix repeat protein